MASEHPHQDEPDARERELTEHPDRLVSLLESVLVDPDLHTDTRMRLHRRISQMLRETAP